MWATVSTCLRIHPVCGTSVLSRIDHIRLMAAYNAWINARLYEAAARNFFSLVMHFFNHQAHHRGQVTTLLSQTGIDIGVTDLLALIPDEAGA